MFELARRAGQLFIAVTMFSFVCFFIMQLWLTDVEIFATIVAALVHDYEHNGTTNAFHINTGCRVPTATIIAI